MTLEADTSDAFGLYANWIYNHRIYLELLPTTFSGHDVPEALPVGIGIVPEEIYELFRARHKLLVRAYILGDKLLDRDFQDAVIYGSIDFPKKRKIWPARQTRVGYENTLEHSPLHTFLVYVSSYLNFTFVFKDHAYRHFLHEDSLFDIAAAIMDNRYRGRHTNKAPFTGKTSAFITATRKKAQSATDKNTGPEVADLDDEPILCV